jgi:hypothetical protein
MPGRADGGVRPARHRCTAIGCRFDSSAGLTLPTPWRMKPQVAAETSSGQVVPRARARFGDGGLLANLLRNDALLLASWATFAAALVWRLSGQVNQDAWLALVGGREVASHGLPHHEVLTVWGQGQLWIDQQWLAQLALYGVYAAGGIALLALAHAVLTAGAYAAAIAAARRLGGSSRSVLFLLPACFWLLIGSTWQVRSQSLAYLPFVALVWLLAADSRAPSRRVYLGLPLLAIWANLHGSVALGACLVALRGLAYAFERPRRPARTAALLLAPAVLLATPYGLSVVGYYRDTLFNPAFGAMLNEWQPPTLNLMTAPFFALALGVAWLAGRCRGRLTSFELLALGFTCAAGLLAVRNLGWFAFTALVLVPGLLDEAFPSRPRSATGTRLNAILAAFAVGLLLVLLALTPARPAAWFESGYPTAAADAVAHAAAADPDARIYADVKYGDWLLWSHPELAGRIAYDTRFELLSRRRILEIYDFNLPQGEPWRVPIRGYRLLVLDRVVDAEAIGGILHSPAARALFSGDGAVVIAR